MKRKEREESEDSLTQIFGEDRMNELEACGTVTAFRALQLIFDFLFAEDLPNEKAPQVNIKTNMDEFECYELLWNKVRANIYDDRISYCTFNEVKEFPKNSLNLTSLESDIYHTSKKAAGEIRGLMRFKSIIKY
jgi:hypothetical protein